MLPLVVSYRITVCRSCENNAVVYSQGISINF